MMVVTKWKCFCFGCPVCLSFRFYFLFTLFCWLYELKVFFLFYFCFSVMLLLLQLLFLRYKQSIFIFILAKILQYFWQRTNFQRWCWLLWINFWEYILYGEHSKYWTDERKIAIHKCLLNPRHCLRWEMLGNFCSWKSFSFEYFTWNRKFIIFMWLSESKTGHFITILNDEYFVGLRTVHVCGRRV